MPVKWVLHWVPSAGSTANTQIMNEISQCVESLNGVKEGRWKSVITFYKPMTREPAMAAEFARDFLGISIPDQPKKYYFIIRGQRIIFEADSNIELIMEKLQSYKSRVSLNFEVNAYADQVDSLTRILCESKIHRDVLMMGIQYQVGDFQLRVGKVSPSHSESMRGIVMEVEYLPLSSIDKSRQVLEDFIDIWKDTLSKRSLPGQFLHIEPNYTDYGLLDQYTSQHTAVQYATVMAQMIATVQPNQQVRN